MKLNKLFMRKILILLLAVFVIVPIMILIFGVPNVNEGFYDMSDKDEFRMTALDISGLELKNNTNADEKITGASGDRLYCIMGDISCNGISGQTYDVSLVGTEDGVNVYQCVSGNTVNPSAATCTSSTFGTGDTGLTFYKFSPSGEILTGNDAEMYTLKEFNFTGTPLSDTSNFNQFVGPYTFAPVKKVSDTPYIKFPISADLSDVSFSICPFYEENLFNCQTSFSSSSDTDTKSTDDTSSDEITCNAHHGTKPGEKLCCGQTGVFQSKSSRACPYEKPTCKNFKCGSTWGTCHKD
jgi:hypothetical protein